MNTMRNTFLLWLAAVAISAAWAADDQAVKKDMALLQGEWAMVSGSADGQPMPEFDMQYKRLSQVEKEYGTNIVNAREIILSDIAEIETPAVAAGLGRLFNTETNIDLK